MKIYEVFAYKTVYDVLNKSPKVIVTPPVKDEKEAEAYARREVPDPFMLKFRITGQP